VTSLAVMREAVALLERGEPFALATVASSRGSVPGKPGAKMIVLPDRRQIGTVGGAGLEEKVKTLALECLAARKGGVFRFDLSYHRPGGLDSLCGGSVEIVVEPMLGRPHVLICGGGHVGLEVARLCDQLEYAYSVMDDRAEFASVERFPSARGRFVATPEGFFATAELAPYSHLLILGYSHRVDTDVLEQALRRFPGFIGVIASRAKRKEMFQRMRERGIADADLARVEAPLGVAIGGETPAEIAVSILGSVIRDHKAVARADTGGKDDGDET
jgi:xanthine dehydrogenase accessory factor